MSIIGPGCRGGIERVRFALVNCNVWLPGERSRGSYERVADFAYGLA